MKPTLDAPNQDELIHKLKPPLAIIRSHSEHLLTAYDRLSAQQALTLLKAIQSQTIFLEHLLDEMVTFPPTQGVKNEILK
jgi:light-regulated signal transduction histidine kinase (bacteriophytochrome)